MATYTVNPEAVVRARKLIEARRHKAVELAAHDLLQHLDRTSG
jgi:hypothetical protein